MTAEADDIFPSEITIIVSVTVLNDEFLAELHVQTEAKLVCDRCGKEFFKLLKGDVKTLFTFDRVKAGEDESGEIRWISPHDQELDITQDALDALYLCIPSKQLCMPDCCGLCPKCGIDLNKRQCQCSNEETDSRWDALKNIPFH
jgi:uncharacterized protein